MRDESGDRPVTQAGLTKAEQAAVFMLRQIMDGQPSGDAVPATEMQQAASCPDLDRAASIFRNLWTNAGESRRRPLHVNSLENHALTKDERRFLKAIAAAQAEDMPLLDNFLYKIALDWEGRRGLAEAVMIMAAALRR